MSFIVLGYSITHSMKYVYRYTKMYTGNYSAFPTAEMNRAAVSTTNVFQNCTGFSLYLIFRKFEGVNFRQQCATLP